MKKKLPPYACTKKEGLINSDRKLEVFEHGIKKEWGYEAPQTDTFIVIHPEKPKKSVPLYVVLHSAGHDVFSAVAADIKSDWFSVTFASGMGIVPYFPLIYPNISLAIANVYSNTHCLPIEFILL